jgi:hypothetical protein
MGFAKVHASISDSSIMDEALHVRWLWVILLTRADENGNVTGTLSALARRANITLEEAEDAMRVLTSPDPNSTSAAEEGRRVVDLGENQWFIVNHAYYRDRALYERKKELSRIRSQIYRERKKEAADGRSSPDSASDESRDKASGRENQKKGVAKDKSSNPRRSPARFVPPSLEEVRAYCESKGYSFDPEAFHAFYESKGWKVGKNPMKSWKAACVTWQKRREKDGPVNGNPASNHTQTPEGGEWVVYTYRQADLDEHGKKEDWSEYLDYAMGCEPETAEPYNTWRSSQ